ncbi:uncharacterized protein LOC125229289 [Leguminivora glycinivorella]|uniref:uncharacterized protein LOC125229289 n=1 Tax=Leguminivora glycinivorella TaxID=1035111 RepID=UPI00200BD90F|nr:uncharacterized protein LOC125229289 [Leguminivora glycinivorella]
MWFHIATLVIFCFKISAHARSIDSSHALDRLISSGIRNNRPIIIIIDPSKSLGIDRENEEYDEAVYKKYEHENDNLLTSALRMRADNTNTCKKFVRQKLKGKCSKESDCYEILWDLANQVCDDDGSKQSSNNIKDDKTPKLYLWAKQDKEEKEVKTDQKDKKAKKGKLYVWSKDDPKKVVVSEKGKVVVNDRTLEIN